MGMKRRNAMMDEVEVEVSAAGFLKRDDELTAGLACRQGASAKNFQKMDCVDSIDKLSENCLLLMNYVKYHSLYVARTPAAFVILQSISCADPHRTNLAHHLAALYSIHAKRAAEVPWVEGLKRQLLL
ncbi:predicted protein [Histoplasma capsulatum var. duboisii H88]|uniref:Predicted protein n=1 Tax=Ajellomyces capsulatus (strain H88) TaxID=544711 RepID=F0U929_AJEC8|nr:predicted protein [Histoplasma capsulatum var. duboisii H88]